MKYTAAPHIPEQRGATQNNVIRRQHDVELMRENTFMFENLI